ncbi:MAG: hypothetical protein LQ337_007892, partial [Flavoplaca oasis]
MDRTSATIRPLPDDVAAQIKSSTTISSLEHVIVELLKNSLDASSHKIEISVNFTRGACTVEDDGSGIKPGEFLDNGGLGKAYRTLCSSLWSPPRRDLIMFADTSKFGGSNDLHGREGTFLASLAAVSILTITSHHSAHRSSATLIYHRSKPAARLVPAPSRHQLANREHGTKVDVHDLFGNMPVRVKQRGLTCLNEREHQRQWDSIRRKIVGFILAWRYPVTVILRAPGSDKNLILRNKTFDFVHKEEDDRASKPLDINYLTSILSQAGYIEPNIRETWIKTSARTPFVTIHGAFSLQPAPSKKTQFISFGIRHMGPDTGASILYNEINHTFALSSFGNLEDLSDHENATSTKSKDGRYKHDGPTNKQLRGAGKGVDRWPMFVIRIEMEGCPRSNVYGERETHGREGTLAGIVKILNAMTTGFLTDHHFRPRTRQRRRPPGSRQNAYNALKDAQGREMASASSSSITSFVCRPRSSQSTNHTNEQTKTAVCDDETLSCNVQLPRIHSDRGLYAGAFDGWSRIKSGATRGVADGGLDVKTIVQPCRTVQRHPPSVQPPHEALQDGSAELVEEDTFTWINPLTKAPYLLNARTGQSVPPMSRRPPGSEIDGTCEEAVRRPNGIEKLPRCASTIIAPKPDSWVGGLLKAWNNPVFSPAAEPAIPQVSFEGPTLETPDGLNGRHRGCSHRDIEKAFSEASTTLPSARLSKSGLLNAKIISQVDRKFILVLIEQLQHDGHSPSDIPGENQILVLIDQHAADERVRIEALLAELCTPPSPETLCLNPLPGIATTLLPKPMVFQTKTQEHRLFDAYTHHLARWGILYELTQSTKAASSTLDITTSITVRYLPPVIAERCRLEPKLLIDLLRKEVWKCEEAGQSTRPSKTPTTDTINTPPTTWLTQLTTCPLGIIDMLNSRACRSAIMFNDELSRAECETVVAR